MTDGAVFIRGHRQMGLSGKCRLWCSWMFGIVTLYTPGWTHTYTLTAHTYADGYKQTHTHSQAVRDLTELFKMDVWSLWLMQTADFCAKSETLWGSENVKIQATRFDIVLHHNLLSISFFPSTFATEPLIQFHEQYMYERNKMFQTVTLPAGEAWSLGYTPFGCLFFSSACLIESLGITKRQFNSHLSFLTILCCICIHVNYVCMFTVIDGAALRIDDRLRVAKERREEADKQQGKTVIPVTIFKVALLNTEGCNLFERKKWLDFSLKNSIVL